MNKLLSLSIIALMAHSTTYAAKEPLTSVTEIIELPGAEKSKIFDSSKMWVAKNFKSANHVIQYEDPTTGSIIAKGNMQYPCKGTWNCLGKSHWLVLFTLKIDTKDERARLNFTDLMLRVPANTSSGSLMPAQEYSIHVEVDKEYVDTGLRKVAQELKSEVSNYDQDNNW